MGGFAAFLTKLKIYRQSQQALKCMSSLFMMGGSQDCDNGGMGFFFSSGKKARARGGVAV